MNPIRTLVETIADRIHATGDAEALTQGLTVVRLPWGGRRVYDPRVAVWLERRRRAICDGFDFIDRALTDDDACGARRSADRCETRTAS